MLSADAWSIAGKVSRTRPRRSTSSADSAPFGPGCARPERREIGEQPIRRRNAPEGRRRVERARRERAGVDAGERQRDVVDDGDRAERRGGGGPVGARDDADAIEELAADDDAAIGGIGELDVQRFGRQLRRRRRVAGAPPPPNASVTRPSWPTDWCAWPMRSSLLPPLTARSPALENVMAA